MTNYSQKVLCERRNRAHTFERVERRSHFFVLFSAFNRILKKIKFQFLVLAQFGNLEANAGLEKEKNSQRKNREEKQS